MEDTMTLPNATNRIIEIIGPPGVGKSTLYKMLCESWQPDQTWIYQDALLASPKPSISNFTKWVEFNYRILTKKKRAKSIPVDFGLRFINTHSQFADLCWRILNNKSSRINGHLDQRYRSAYFLFADFCRYQAIKEKMNGRYCVIDEGFLQKSFLVKDQVSDFSELLEDYLSLAPLPHATIYIEATDELIIKERLRIRDKVIASHLGKSDHELLEDISNWKFTLDLITNKLIEQDTLVFRVDGTKKLEDNVQRILKFLNEL
ncbi:hypothetical protein H9Q13_11105 [Pontibacter sp. JH31]|uniref:Deoxynucleoside kinase domain-containing protein n=1 Tax=Pontibacter aquaedesilientis TaxID=2766980 RepID=A0ABR7XHE8_9BACT|nr:hypothetical protein [Pontibacter aquaedesilientis]MBD1397713.1 hypothetical protein [Pontibacter aquaedesilientis]